MNNLDKQYTALLQDILDNGVKKGDRTGVGTLSVFGRQIRHKMSEGFPLLTTKKMYTKGVIAELFWFLRGDTNIKYLVDNDCHIWDGDAYKNYLSKINNGRIYPNSFTQEKFINKIKTDDEFAKKWGDLGPIYGKQWRSWGRRNVVNYDLENVKSSDKVKVMDLIRDGGDYSKYDVKVTYQNNSIDQIQNLINDLKTNPDSRRLMVNAWNVGELDQMVLPPCHYGFQVYTRELSIDEKEGQLEKTNCINDIENDRIIYGHEWEKYIQEQYEGIQSTQGIKIPTRAISLMWNQRSVDTFLGLPFNIASYGLLLEIIAQIVNMVPDEIVGTLGDTHLYLNHLDQAREQIGRDLTPEERYNRWFDLNYETGMERFYDPEKLIIRKAGVIPPHLPDYDNSYYEPTPTRTREPFPLPTLRINTEFWPTESGECGVGPLATDVDAIVNNMQIDDFQIEGYKSHPTIKAPLNN